MSIYLYVSVSVFSLRLSLHLALCVSLSLSLPLSISLSLSICLSISASMWLLALCAQRHGVQTGPPSTAGCLSHLHRCASDVRGDREDNSNISEHVRTYACICISIIYMHVYVYNCIYVYKYACICGLMMPGCMHAHIQIYMHIPITHGRRLDPGFGGGQKSISRFFNFSSQISEWPF